MQNKMYSPKKSIRYGINFILLLLVVLCHSRLVAQTPPPLPVLATGVNESLFTTVNETYFVSTNNGDDLNSGSSALPFKTFTKGINKGLERKAAGKNVKIIIGNGIYREKTEIPEITNDNDASLIIEADNTGQAIISGSEDWSTQLTQEGSNWTHAWTDDWGVEESYSKVTNEVGRRRELIFVSNVLYTQVASKAELSAGSYYVDELNDKIFIRPLTGVNMNTALVEAGRSMFLFTIQANRKSIAVKGLVFKHDVNFPGKSASKGAFRIGKDCRNILLQDVSINWNNGLGLGSLDTANQRMNITFRRVKMNNNGGGGMFFNMSQNLLFEDCETNYNRFRSKWANQIQGVDGGGFKVFKSHRTAFIRHQAIGNFGRGMWWDDSNRDMTAKDCLADGNYGSGLFVEYSFGPALIENCTVINTKQAILYTLRNQGGLQFASTANLTIKNCIVKNNIQSQIKCWDQQRTTTDHLTGQTKTFDITNVGNIYLRGNTVEGSDTTHTLIDIPDWTFLKETWDSNNNTYIFPDRNKVFRIYPGGTGEGDDTSDTAYFKGTNYSFAEWKGIVGNEVNSTFNSAITFSNVDSYTGNSVNYQPLNQTRWSVLGDESNRRYAINLSTFDNLSGQRLGEYSLLKNRSYGNFTLTLNAKTAENLVTNTSADYALIFGYVDANNYYYMLLTNDRTTTQLFKVVAGVRQLIATAPANKGIIDNSYHGITLIRSGNTVTVKRDATQLLSVTNSGLGIAGGIGIGSFNDAAFFDDVDITGSFTATTLAALSSDQNSLQLQNSTTETQVGKEALRVFPNPVVGVSTINYYLPQAGKVKLVAYDDMGRVVNTLVDRQQTAGSQQAQLNGGALPAGIYYLRLQTGTGTQAIKVVIANN